MTGQGNRGRRPAIGGGRTPELLEGLAASGSQPVIPLMFTEPDAALRGRAPWGGAAFLQGGSASAGGGAACALHRLNGF